MGKFAERILAVLPPTTPTPYLFQLLTDSANPTDYFSGPVKHHSWQDAAQRGDEGDHDIDDDEPEDHLVDHDDLEKVNTCGYTVHVFP